MFFLQALTDVALIVASCVIVLMLALIWSIVVVVVVIWCCMLHHSLTCTDAVHMLVLFVFTNWCEYILDHFPHVRIQLKSVVW